MVLVVAMVGGWVLALGLGYATIYEKTVATFVYKLYNMFFTIISDNL